MTPERVAPAWMHAQISAEHYDSWPEEQCSGIEIVDGMVVASPSASKRHNRLARILANALDAAAGPDWNADTDFDVRLQDVPLTNRRPDVTVYRAETIDFTPTRPEHVLLVVEVVSPGSETTDRIVKVDQYAKAGIPFYWRIEQAATGVPIVYTYVLDAATKAYRDGGMFTGAIKTAAPFSVTVDLGPSDSDGRSFPHDRAQGTARVSCTGVQTGVNLKCAWRVFYTDLSASFVGDQHRTGRRRVGSSVMGPRTGRRSARGMADPAHAAGARRGRRLAAAAVALVAPLLLAACSGDGAARERVPVPPATGAPVPDAMVADPPPGTPPLPPQSERRSAPAATPADRSGASVGPWWFDELSDDGRRVHFWYHSEPTCDYEPIGVLVTETAEHVEIAPLRAYTPPREGQACALVLQGSRPAYVDLAEPLGGRDLLHAPLTDR